MRQITLQIQNRNIPPLCLGSDISVMSIIVAQAVWKELCARNGDVVEVLIRPYQKNEIINSLRKLKSHETKLARWRGELTFGRFRFTFNEETNILAVSLPFSPRKL
jgi:hypothetical protein